VVYEWDAAKARANLQKHGMFFDEAATVFLDSLALTFPDPDGEDEREITIDQCCERRPEESAGNMKKGSAKRIGNDLRTEYNLSQLQGGVRGKYYQQAVAGTNLMLIEPELASVFRDSESVNRTLRLLVDTAAAAARPGRRHRAANKALPRTAQKQRRR
jgi:hypothetical protein